MELKKISRALISVSDKANLARFALSETEIRALEIFFNSMRLQLINY